MSTQSVPSHTRLPSISPQQKPDNTRPSSAPAALLSTDFFKKHSPPCIPRTARVINLKVLDTRTTPTPTPPFFPPTPTNPTNDFKTTISPTFLGWDYENPSPSPNTVFVKA